MKRHPVLATLLSLSLVLSIAPVAAFADPAEGEGGTGDGGEVVTAQDQRALEAELEAENITETAITLKALEPRTLGEGEEAITVEAEYAIGSEDAWQPTPEFTGLNPNTSYTFYARYAADEGGKYNPSNSISASFTTKAAAPVISTPTVKGLKTSLKKKAGKKLTNTIAVSPAGVYSVKLQMKVGKKWKKYGSTFKTNAAGKVKLVYPKQWWQQKKSTWRVYIAATSATKAFYSKNIKVKAPRRYQTPGKYFKIHDKDIVIKGGGYKLSQGYMGLKVKKVNNYFGIGDRFWPRYSSNTRYHVRNFQSRHGLSATGNVNLSTWLEMGFDEDDWYEMGAYASPLDITRASTKKDCIEAMIDRGYEYYDAHTPYCVGGSGEPGEGADCSGFVMQCLYAAGISPTPSTPVRHSKPAYEYESRRMAHYSKLKKVKLSNIKRGDLVFYRGRAGTVCHVAIYIGGGRCIQSDLNYVQIRGLHRYSGIACVRRPFP